MSAYFACLGLKLKVSGNLCPKIFWAGPDGKVLAVFADPD